MFQHYIQLYLDSMCVLNIFSQNEEEVLFLGRMYEPKRGEGMDHDYMSRIL